jgi:glycosyltransferase involved in cell wall biosynthesis
MQAIQLTVLFATRNGEYVLPRTLDGYRRAVPPRVPWKLVVVDNGSSDQTPAILNSFKRHLPLEVLQQPKAGKSRALNTGLEAIEGKLVVISDDDAIPAPSFLNAWERYLGRCAEFGLFGGRIEPLFEVPPPRWMRKTRSYLATMFAERDLPEGEVEPGDIYGPNMAVRAAIFERGFRFAESIGPNSEDPEYPMGNEVEFCRRVARSGILCWFAREPQVQHIVRPQQYSESAWVGRAYRLGRGRAHLMWEQGSLQAPKVTWADRLAMISPLRQHRFRGLRAYHLARGFNDECARRGAAQVGEQRTPSASADRPRR